MSNFLPDGRHPGSQETYDHIAQWTDTPFPFSKKDGWERFGILGVLSQLILRGLPETDIIEIGTGESSIYLTETARRLNRRIFYVDEALGKITNPLTIKGYLHEDTILIQNSLGEAYTKDYSKNKAVAFCGTSDEYFRHMNLKANIGFAFIDGEHHYEFVKKDFENIFKLLVPNGIICLHDTYPYNEDLVLGDYCADSYKMRQELEKDPRVDTFTFTKTVAVDVGLTIVRKKPTERPYYNE